MSLVTPDLFIDKIREEVPQNPLSMVDLKVVSAVSGVYAELGRSAYFFDLP